MFKNVIQSNDPTMHPVMPAWCYSALTHPIEISPECHKMTCGPPHSPPNRSDHALRTSHPHDRYLGPVKGQEGTWVGVEWDDATRGKHDGSTGGIKYFTCQSGGTSGSFVRMEKVRGS